MTFECCSSRGFGRPATYSSDINDRDLRTVGKREKKGPGNHGTEDDEEM